MTQDISAKQEEIDFHNGLFSSINTFRKNQKKYYDYRAHNRLFDYALSQLGDIKDKNILYYGCGTKKEILTHLVSHGAKIVAIDISESAIKKMNAYIESRNLGGSVRALCMDCENLKFNTETFDIVFGSAIIHHLDINKAISEIKHVLKPAGRAVFIEPLGMNPIINIYRFFTPKARTNNERPLKEPDLALFEKNFKVLTRKNFYFISLLPVFFKRFFRRKMFLKNILLNAMDMDNFILQKYPFLNKFAWCTILTLVK